MTTDVYVDLLFLINFSMDYICLYITARIMHRSLGILRLALAATLGGAYSVCSLFFETSPAIALIIDILACVGLCAVAFIEKKRATSSFFVCTALYVGVSMLTGGIMTALFNQLSRVNFPIDSIEEDGLSVWLFAFLAIAAAIISISGGRLALRRAGVRSCRVIIEFDGKKKEFSGFCDSGNLICDTLSGRRVILVDSKSAEGLVDTKLTDRFLCGDLPCEKAYRGIRMIPINTASGRSMLAALCADKITLIFTHGKRGKACEITTDALFALSDIGNSAEGHDAIVPEEIMKP